MKISKMVCEIIFLLALSCQALAVHQLFNPQGDAIDSSVAIAFRFPNDLEKTNLKIAAMGPDNPFEWAGPLVTRRANYSYPCTGGVVSLPNSKPEDKVLVLTAGHCVTSKSGEFLKPKEVLLNQELQSGNQWFEFPRDRKFSIKDENGVSAMTLRRFEISKIIFASFDVFDLALLEMDLTYKDLEYKNQRPPVISRKEVKPQESVRAFGIPQSNEYESFLFHQADCKVIEQSTFANAIKNVDPETPYLFQDRLLSTCTLFGGMSGGYVRNAQGEVVAVNGAVSSDGYSLLNSVKPLAKCLSKDESKFEIQCLKDLAISITDRQ